jgi:4-amino-4-deoxy-L-arabinose transferase-like glycosyltransferase
LLLAFFFSFTLCAFSFQLNKPNASMPYKNRRSSYSTFILIFVALKIVLNLFAISNFGFHRDELLHLVLGDHLDWGYKEVPPFIALLAKITLNVFGHSVFAARIFSTIASGFIIWLTGQITAELGGRRFAITLACLALIFAPAFAASGYLFQPVVFDQLWWVVTVWLFVRYLNTATVKYLYWLGVAVGIGMLTKYTMAFFTVSLIVGILISKERKLLFNKHVVYSALLAILIFLPNIIWQFAHHLPVIHHMKELRETQLDYIQPIRFYYAAAFGKRFGAFYMACGIYQSYCFRSGCAGSGFWLSLISLYFCFCCLMNGKIYYLFGAYPMLFAAGGFTFERILNRKAYILRVPLPCCYLLYPIYFLLPLVLPILSLK